MERILVGEPCDAARLPQHGVSRAARLDCACRLVRIGYIIGYLEALHETRFRGMLIFDDAGKWTMVFNARDPCVGWTRERVIGLNDVRKRRLQALGYKRIV